MNARRPADRTRMALAVLLAAIAALEMQTFAQGPTRPVARTVVAGPTVTAEQFGAIGDCVADDTPALLAMRDSLRAVQDANAGAGALLLTMSFAQGRCYRYTNNRWTWGLRHLRLLGNGARFQNTYDARRGPWGPYGAYVFVSNRGPFSNLTTLESGDRSGSQGTDYGQRIASTRPMDVDVTLLEPREARRFKAGDWAMVHSYDQQIMTSWPPNARYVDYVRIAAVDSSRGRLTLDRPLAHGHSAAFPEVDYDYYQPPQQRTGRARIVKLGDDVVPFAETLVMRDMTFLWNPGARRSDNEDDYLWKSHNYLLIQGVHSARLENVTAGMLAPSHAAVIRIVRSHFYMAEVDKLIGLLDIADTRFDVHFTACTGAWRVRMKGGVIGGPLQTESKVYKITASTCVPRYGEFDGVTFNTPYMTNRNLPTYSLNNYHPIHALRIVNSTFNGGGPPSIPIGAIPVLTLDVIGGSGPRTTDVHNQVRFSAWTRVNALGSREQAFLRCTEPGGVIGLLKAGAKAEILGTLRKVSGAGNDAILDIDIAATIENGDRLSCKPVRPGAIELAGNTYNNYGGPPDLRY